MTVSRNPAEAVGQYRHAVQRLLSCVTDSVVDVAGGYYPSDIPHRLALNLDLPVSLGGASRFMLKMRHNDYIVESVSSENLLQVYQGRRHLGPPGCPKLKEYVCLSFKGICHSSESLCYQTTTLSMSHAGTTQVDSQHPYTF